MTEVEDLRNNVKEMTEKVMVESKKVIELKAQKITLEAEMKTINEEFRKVKSQKLYFCHICCFCTENGTDLKQHVMQSHCQDNESQIDDLLVDRNSDTGFVEYRCFYCEEMITSVNSLETHLTNCRLYVQCLEVF